MVIGLMWILLGESSRQVEYVRAIFLERLVMIDLVKGIAHIILKSGDTGVEVPRSLSVVSNVCNLCGGLLNR